VDFLQELIYQSKRFGQTLLKPYDFASKPTCRPENFSKLKPTPTLYVKQQMPINLKLYRKTIKYLTLTTKYARGKIIIIYQRNCSAQAIEVG
jgi:hypothetical protein